MELDRLEKRIRALQARKAARAATFERVQGIDPTEHEAAVWAFCGWCFLHYFLRL